jgi:hypothetical protein
MFTMTAAKPSSWAIVAAVASSRRRHVEQGAVAGEGAGLTAFL